MTKFRNIKLLAATAVLVALSSGQALGQAGVTLSLNYDPTKPPGVMVLPVAGELGDSIRTIIDRDLGYSNRFTMVRVVGNDPNAFRSPNGGVNYQLAAQMGADIVVQPVMTTAGVHLVLHSVGQARVEVVKDFPVMETSLSREWRMRLHTISDAVEESITGTPGIAATRIAYYRHQRLYVIDSDGAFDIQVPAEEDPYSPAWHPSGESLVYATLGSDSRIISVDLRTGRSVVRIPPVQNVSFQSPTYSPDGTTLFYVRADEIGAHIHRASAPEWIPQRLTTQRQNDNTTPSASPDGRRLTFTTMRTGHNEVYIMNADGTNPEIVQNWRDQGQDNIYRAEPDWSPDGSKIALITQVGGRGAYQLMVVNLRDRTAVRLTSEGANEQPSWAPDSRHIVFTSDRLGTQQLFIMDVESKVIRQLTRNTGSKLPAWSPRLGR